jgi:hypothetical protein
MCNDILSLALITTSINTSPQILAKLGAGSRAEAVAIGMRRGLVPT